MVTKAPLFIVNLREHGLTKGTRKFWISLNSITILLILDAAVDLSKVNIPPKESKHPIYIMNAFIYACMYFMHLYIQIMHMWACYIICTNVHIYACMHAYIYVCMHTCVSTCINCDDLHVDPVCTISKIDLYRTDFRRLDTGNWLNCKVRTNLHCQKAYNVTM